MQDDQATPSPRGMPGAPDDVWAAVRADYLAGLSATACARKHGVGASTLHARAAAEGWRRADQPWAPPRNRLDPDDEGVALEDQHQGDLDRIGPGDLAWVAERRMMRAVLRGDATEALRWARVHRIMDERHAELDRWIEQDDRLAAERDARSPEQAEAVPREFREYRERVFPDSSPDEA